MTILPNRIHRQTMHHFVLVFCIDRTKSAVVHWCSHHTIHIWNTIRNLNTTNHFHKNNCNSQRKAQLIEIIAIDFFFFVLRVFIVLSSIWLLIVCTSMYIWKIFVNWRLYCNLKFHAKKNYCFFSQFLSIFWC